jgi:hypothetical protein
MNSLFIVQAIQNLGYTSYFSVLDDGTIKFDDNNKCTFSKEDIDNEVLKILEKNNLREKINEATKYLNDTQFKFGIDYEPKEGENLEEIRIKRSEARKFIRENENIVAQLAE